MAALRSAPAKKTVRISGWAVRISGWAVRISGWAEPTYDRESGADQGGMRNCMYLLELREVA
jgi:hypothetical protein